MRKKFTLVASLAFAAALCAGIAGANVNAKAETNWSDFEISATAIRTASPAGLRFKVDCPVDYSANDAVEAWTTINFTSSVEGEEKSYSTNVPVTYWRDASGWNTVLLEIPASDYVTEITAQAFIKVDENTTYQSAAVTSSIAKTAAKLMNGGETDGEVTKYVAGAVTNITLAETAAIDAVGGTTQLTATTNPAGFDVVWASSNTDVATVAADGTVTATGIGSANITASMGGASATCKVSVGDEWCRTNNVSAANATIDANQQVEFVKGTTSDGDWNRTDTNECEIGYLAFNGSYGVGDFVAFDFTGNNMPVITLAAKNVNEDYHNRPMDTTDTGIVVRNGYANTQGTMANNNHNKRIEAYGPYKFQDTGVAPYAAQGLGTGVGMLELVDSTDQFRAIVGIESMTTPQIKVGVVIQNLTKDTQPVFNTITIDITSANLANTFEGSIILHGRLGFTTTIDKLYPVYENTDKDTVKWALPKPDTRTQWEKDNNVTSSGVTIDENQKVEFVKGTTSDGEWNRTDTNECKIGYLAFNGSYGVGDFVVFDFTGNNMPVITLAAKNVNEDYYNRPKDMADTGIVVRNGYANTQGTMPSNNHNKRIEAYGPYKFQDTGVAPYAAQGLGMGVGMLELVNSTDQFRAIIGIESMTTTQIKVGVVIVNLTQKTQPVFNTITLDITNAGLTNTFEGSIILHGRLGFDTKLDKVYTIYEDTDKGTVKWSIPGSNF